MAETRGGAGWLKWGCAGCGALLGLVVLIVLGVGGFAWRMARSQKVEDQVLTHDLPAPPEAPAGGAPAAPPADQGAGAALEGSVARVVLDLSHAEFRIEPAKEGEPLRVEARYDASSYELREATERPEGGPWTYRVTFRRSAPGLLVLASRLFGAASPEVTVFLPPGSPIVLEIQLQDGGMEGELDGLWLQAAEVDLRRGGLVWSIDEPLRAPVDHLSVHASMGGVVLSGLGNASPRRLDLDVHMGGVQLDLRGRWTADADVRITSRMAGGVVRLPEDVRVLGLSLQQIPLPGEVREGLPLLSFTFDGDPDDWEFRD